MCHEGPYQHSHHDQPHSQNEAVEVSRCNVENNVPPSTREGDNNQAHYKQQGSNQAVQAFHPEQEVLEVLSHQGDRGEADSGQDAGQQGALEAKGANATRVPEVPTAAEGRPSGGCTGLSGNIGLPYAGPRLLKGAADQDVQLVTVLRGGPLQPAVQLNLSLAHSVFEKLGEQLHSRGPGHRHGGPKIIAKRDSREQSDGIAAGMRTSV